MGNYFICKGSILKLYKSLMKEAGALSAKAESLQPQAAEDYAKAMVRWNSWDFAKAECYHPRHCYDEIKSLSKEAKDLRDKAKKLQVWIDTFTWIKYPEGERADCSKRQSEFLFKAISDYQKLIDKYYPK